MKNGWHVIHKRFEILLKIKKCKKKKKKSGHTGEKKKIITREFGFHSTRRFLIWISCFIFPVFPSALPAKPGILSNPFSLIVSPWNKISINISGKGRDGTPFKEKISEEEKNTEISFGANELLARKHIKNKSGAVPPFAYLLNLFLPVLIRVLWCKQLARWSVSCLHTRFHFSPSIPGGEGYHSYQLIAGLFVYLECV